MNTQTQKTMAGEILRQLGGNRFIAMTGAKNFACGLDENNELMMTCKIMRNAKGISYLRVIYNAIPDTYTMQFIDSKIRVKSEKTSVYCDMLQGVFTENTHLYTHL